MGYLFEEWWVRLRERICTHLTVVVDDLVVDGMVPPISNTKELSLSAHSGTFAADKTLIDVFQDRGDVHDTVHHIVCAGLVHPLI